MNERSRRAHETFRERRARLAFAARAWLCAVPVEASLAALGLETTLRWIEAVPARSARGPRVSVADGEKLVARAYRLHVVRGQCLPRSLVQYLGHRRDGVPARFVVGVRRPEDAPRGLEAHAWVEAPDAPSDVPFTELFASEKQQARDDSLPLSGLRERGPGGEGLQEPAR